MGFVNIACPVCGLNDWRFLFSQSDIYMRNPSKKFFNIYECDQCGICAIFPAPNDAELESFYPSAYEPYKKDTRTREYIKSLADLYPLYMFIKRSVVPNGKILEIGPGNGEGALYLKSRGFRVDCVEKGSNKLENLENNGIRVIYTELEKCELEERYDAVILRHVFEHIKNPVNAISKIKKWLNPEGALIIEVPNSRGWDKRIFKSYWIGYDPPRHLFTYSDKNLKRLLDKNGFKVLRCKHRLSPSLWAHSFSNWLHEKCGVCVAGSNLILILIFYPVQALSCLFGHSGQIMLLCRKT